MKWDEREHPGAELVELVYSQAIVPKKKGTTYAVPISDGAQVSFFHVGFGTAWQNLRTDDGDVGYEDGAGGAPFGAFYRDQVLTDAVAPPASAQYFVEYRARWDVNPPTGVATIRFGFQVVGGNNVCTAALDLTSGAYALANGYTTYTTPQLTILNAVPATPVGTLTIEMDLDDTNAGENLITWARVKIVP